jgi:hypothetical protein
LSENFHEKCIISRTAPKKLTIIMITIITPWWICKCSFTLDPKKLSYLISGTPNRHSVGYFYFPLWTYYLYDQPILGIFASCIIIILACFCMEFIRWYRIYRKKQLLSEARESGQINGPSNRLIFRWKLFLL